MDVLYVLGNGSKWRDNEIRYSIRSLETYCKDLGDIYVVGNCPDFLKNVNYIECPDPFEEKERNSLYKTLKFCNEYSGESFLKCDDDFFFNKDFFISQIPVYSKGLLEETLTKLNEFSRYAKVFKHTMEVLKENNQTTFDFEVHNPVVYNRKDFIEIMQRMDTTKPFCMKSIYFNYKKETGVKGMDMKINIPLPIERIKIETENVPFFSVGDKGLMPPMKTFLEQRYSRPSSYEATL